jgi:hypothetical protein
MDGMLHTNEIIEIDDEDESVVDTEVIEEAIQEVGQMVEMLDAILEQLHALRVRMGGICVVYDGESQPLSALLPLWKEEYEKGVIHRITWGQFLIEKLRGACA